LEAILDSGSRLYTVECKKLRTAEWITVKVYDPPYFKIKKKPHPAKFFRAKFMSNSAMLEDFCLVNATALE